MRRLLSTVESLLRGSCFGEIFHQEIEETQNQEDTLE